MKVAVRLKSGFLTIVGVPMKCGLAANAATLNDADTSTVAVRIAAVVVSRFIDSGYVRI
ncbi:hypothetical protein [Nitrososphaera sp.]|uniref:hypothetical protein n=1 Tax=Nitrososphaera sp. TaxID=1971748 RepID=UPI003D6F5378